MEQSPASVILSPESTYTHEWQPRVESVSPRGRVDLSRLTLEGLLYIAIFTVALLTRFWDLGSRALHHDESLHAYFSWIFAEGHGYIHNPLMHGPFLFHANALLYLLLGTSDYVTRIMPATVGVIVVMMPWLLRGPKLLGRWGALSAAALLLVSPSILYYSRFLRHDIYCLFGTFALFIAIARFVERPDPRWVILGGAAAGFLITTKEVSFIVFFLFATFLGVAIARRVAPPLLALGAAAGVTMLIVAKLLKALGAPPLPGIPWDSPTGQEIEHFTIKLFEHPLVIAGFGITLLTVILAIWLLDRRRPEGVGWIDGILGAAEPGSTAAALREMLRERRGLLIGIAAAVGIYVVLYTTLFTNMLGLASGSFGALGYWLGQQGVQRGEEPWFYYLLLLPQYEFVAVILFPVCLAWLGISALRTWRGGLSFGHRFYMRALMVYWALGMLAVLSWAGEKMPWLVVHIALPMTLLAASYIGEALDWLDQHRCSWLPSVRREMLALAGAIVLLFGAAVLVLAWASAGPYVQTAHGLQRTLRPAVTAHWWETVYLPWLLLAALLVLAVVRLGWRRSATVLMVTSVGALMLAQIHDEWRLTYREGDVPKDMLIYVQTSPYVPQVTQELTELSQELTGGMGLQVWYDTGTQWPFNWYLRDFTNRGYFGTQLPANVNVPVILISDEFLTPAIEKQLATNYSYQEYPMRWWFPEEETYRKFAYAPDLKNESRQNYQDAAKPPFTLTETAMSALHSIWSLHTPQEQGKMFRLVTYRELPAPLGAYSFRVYVRNDLVPYLNNIRY